MPRTLLLACCVRHDSEDDTSGVERASTVLDCRDGVSFTETISLLPSVLAGRRASDAVGRPERRALAVATFSRSGGWLP